jgi:hypothetical protein
VYREIALEIGRSLIQGPFWILLGSTTLLFPPRMLLSKRKIGLKDNGTISGRGGSELPTGERLTFAKQRRIEHSVRGSEIDDVEEIGCTGNECEVVSSRSCRIEVKLCRTAA